MAGQQQSSIDLLQDDVREKLNALLRDPKVTQKAARIEINKILEAMGADERLSRSSVNRYAKRMDKVGARIREGREVAQMWISSLGAEPQGEVGKLLNEMIRNLAFDVTSRMMEMMDDPDSLPEPKMLRDLAIAVEKLEKAASENVKRDEEIRKQVMTEAAEKAGAAAKQAGVSEETIQIIRRDVLRMAN